MQVQHLLVTRKNGETNKIYKCTCPQGLQSTIEQTIKTTNIWILTILVSPFNLISGENYKNLTLGKKGRCMFEELNPRPWVFQGTIVTCWTGWGKGKTRLLENHVCWKGGESKGKSISYSSLLPFKKNIVIFEIFPNKWKFSRLNLDITMLSRTFARAL